MLRRIICWLLIVCFLAYLWRLFNPGQPPRTLRDSQRATVKESYDAMQEDYNE